MKKETRGRKPKEHEPVPATFDDVLGAIAQSEYKEEEELKDNRNKNVRKSK